MARKAKKNLGKPSIVSPAASPVPVTIQALETTNAKPTTGIKERLEIKKLRLEIKEKELGQQFYKSPSFWFSVITAFAAIIGIVGQHFLSAAKFERSTAEAKLADFEKRQADEKAEKANDAAKAADVKEKKANKDRESVELKLSAAQKEVDRLLDQKSQELDQASARQAIRAHNGEVVNLGNGVAIGASFQASPLSMQDLRELKLQFQKLPSFSSLVLTRVELTDEGLSEFAELSGLKELRLNGNPEISGDGLKPLGKFEHLEVLGLGQTGLNDAGLTHLKVLHDLRELYLNDTTIGDDGLVHLSNLTNLRVLSLTNTKVSEHGLELLKSLRQLTDLYLDGTSVTDTGLAHISELSKLKLLSLDDRQITQSSVLRLKDLPGLEILILRGTNFRDDSLAVIKNLPRIRVVDVRGTRVTKNGVEDLKLSVPHLEVRGIGVPVESSIGAINTRTDVATDELLSRKWPTGLILGVQFLDGDSKTHKKVRQVAEQWTDYANVRFDFDPRQRAGEAAPIRVSFKEDSSSWSYVGTDCLASPTTEPTMSLGVLRPDSDENEYSRIVLHEFGHTLGLLHEHQNPNAAIPWNEEAVYKYYSQTQGWTSDQVKANMFTKFKSAYRDFDPKSIMMYQFPARLFRGDFEIGTNTALSKSDKEFIGKLYPPYGPVVNLIVGTPAAKEEITKEGQTQYFTFYAPTKAHYSIESEGPTHVVLSVFGPDSRTDHVASGSVIKQALSAGIYHLTVRIAEVRGKGAYSLRITRETKVGT